MRKTTSRYSSQGHPDVLGGEDRSAFANAGQGPVAGHSMADVSNVCHRTDDGPSERVPALLAGKAATAIDRYLNECRRLFEVLDRLASNEYLAGEYSIADIANWCWVRTHRWSGLGIDHLLHWRDAIEARPADKRGVRIPRHVPALVEATRSEQAERLARSATSILMR